MKSNKECDVKDKREMMTDRMKKREVERLAKCQEKRVDQADNAANGDKIHTFAGEFRSRSERVSALINAGTTTLDGLEEISQELQRLQELVSEVQEFLPTYDRRVSNETLGDLREKLRNRQEALLPRKKFTFASRKAKTATRVIAEDVPDGVQVEMPRTVDCGFADETSTDLSLSAEDATGKAIELQRLKECTVKIFGNPSTVHVGGLRNCSIFVAPVTTSVFVDDCVGVTFRLACQQLRIHSSSKCSFYVHVTSRSIIEDCKEVQFAPYDWHYAQFDEHFSQSGLDHAKNNWNLVDDFNWLVTDVPSPNWSVTPASCELSV